MTKLEIIKLHKKQYAELEEKIKTMPEGLEKQVAANVTLAWIKGNKWMGGLSGMHAYDKTFQKVVDLGYSYEEVDEEFTRQAMLY